MADVTPQIVYAAIWLLLAVLAVSIVLVYYLRSVRGEPDRVFGFITGIRGGLFLVLSLGLLLAFLASIPFYPYPEIRGEPEFYVSVEAVRFAFILNTTVVPANKPIAFLVTSRDVNHAFGIYTEDGRLIAQVQAMPGYVNKLVVTLPPGKYRIMCLEYCGVAHHLMTAVIEARG